jgi:transposase
MTNREAAQVLFVEGYKQTDIAKMFKVSTVTVNKWCAKDNWQQKKISVDLLQDNSVQRIMKMIDYQTRAIERKYESWLKEDEQTMQLIERGDIDALQKLFTTIRQDTKKFSDYVSVLKEFFEWLQHKDIDVAKSMTSFADEFINAKRQQF